MQLLLRGRNMNYIEYILKMVMATFGAIFIMRIYMIIANYIGEQLGIGKALKALWRKIEKNK